MLYRLSYVGVAHTDFEGAPGSGPLMPMEQGDPTPQERLRVRVEKDALPQAGFSSEKAVGE
jgi:hypothetical protein